MNGHPHPWVVVAPWYRWEQPGQPAAGRRSAPVIQKYETAEMVNLFLQDPQHSLRFLDEDHVHEVVSLPPLPLLNGRRKRFTDLRAVKTGTRKLFLDIHKRFYLIVCEVHCDAPGFPNVDPKAVSEAGCVIRRRTSVLPVGAEPAAKALLKSVAGLQVELAHLQEPTSRRLADPLRAAQVSSVQAKLADERAKLVAWAGVNEVRPILQGWVPSGFEKIGAWKEVAERPTEIEETVVPLYPLIPDPAVRDHSGRGRAIFFGIVPTLSGDSDDRGVPRFDDRSLYEARCFVRRRDERGCVETFWSPPTISYQLAAPFDPVGCGKRPVTLPMPDLQLLEAHADPKLATVRFASPEKSALEFEIKDMLPVEGASPDGPAICSFSLPLITLVASFVFQLFLPILMLVFGLWFMLKLKFCIPPKLEVSAGVAAALRAEVNLKLEIAIEANVDINLDADLSAALLLDFQAQFGAVAGAKLHALYSSEALIEMANAIALASGGPDPVVKPGELPPMAAPVSYTADLLWEPRVELEVAA